MNDNAFEAQLIFLKTLGLTNESVENLVAIPANAGTTSVQVALPPITWGGVNLVFVPGNLGEDVKVAALKTVTL